MLSEDEKHAIRAQEEAVARRAIARAWQRRRRRARAAYRARVRSELRLRGSAFWLILTALLVAGFLAARPLLGAHAIPDDTSGGIANSLLALRCRQELRAQRQDTDLSFPTPGEAAAQMTASPDGKRWDGWAQGAGGRTEFSCGYTPATDQINLKIITQGEAP